MLLVTSHSSAGRCRSKKKKKKNSNTIFVAAHLHLHFPVIQPDVYDNGQWWTCQRVMDTKSHARCFFALCTTAGSSKDHKFDYSTAFW